MTKQQAELNKFAKDEQMFDTVKEYILSVPAPEYAEGMDLRDYGALHLAHLKMLKKIRARFDDILREDSVV